MKTPYWTLAIQRAPARVARGLPAFTVIAKFRAGGWTTCACGRQDPRIPKEEPGERGEPRDVKLWEAGIAFTMAVKADDIRGAEEALERIEVRAAEVITEILEREVAQAEKDDATGH